jgi:hypothetical protein
MYSYVLTMGFSMIPLSGQSNLAGNVPFKLFFNHLRFSHPTTVA